MKKLVIVVGLLVVPLIGYCQSPGDRIVFSEAYKQTVNTKVERTVVTQTVNKQIQEQNEIQRILKIKLEAEPICNLIVKDMQNKDENKFICILKAIFIGGKLPWETDLQYKNKLEHSYLIDLK